MEVIDLEKYGMFWSLDPVKMTEPVPESARIAKAVRNNDHITFMNKDETNEILSVNVKDELGRGSYGIIYMTDGSILGSKVVVKIIEVNNEHTLDIVATEVICQIIVANVSENIKNSIIPGSFTPRIHMFAMDDKYYYIVSEHIRYTFHKLINAESVDILKNGIIQVAYILKFLYDILKFNHRDCNPNNIMFNRDGYAKLIDFGFSYMEYGSIIICPGYKFPKEHLFNTKSRSRDLCALFYYIITYTKYKNYRTHGCAIKRVLRTLLMNTNYTYDWEDSFKAYDCQGDMINLTPEVVIKVFDNLIFERDSEYSYIHPKWVNYIQDIRSNTTTYLESEEIKLISHDVIKNL